MEPNIKMMPVIQKDRVSNQLKWIQIDITFNERLYAVIYLKKITFANFNLSPSFCLVFPQFTVNLNQFITVIIHRPYTYS